MTLVLLTFCLTFHKVQNKTIHCAKTDYFCPPYGISPLTDCIFFFNSTLVSEILSKLLCIASFITINCHTRQKLTSPNLVWKTVSVNGGHRIRNKHLFSKKYIRWKPLRVLLHLQGLQVLQDLNTPKTHPQTNISDHWADLLT